MKRIALTVALALTLVGCGGSETSDAERIAAEFSADAKCRKAGLEEVAGEREVTYSCSGHLLPDARTGRERQWFQACAALIDGEFYLLRPRAC